MVGLNLPGFVYKGVEIPEYTGPTYEEVTEQWKKNDPESFNAHLRRKALEDKPNSEIVYYRDADGKILLVGNVGAGYLSGADPLGLLFVEGVVTNPIFKVLGRAFKFLRMKRGFTGVPHKLVKGSSKYMDENFMDYDGTIWTSNNKDYARLFANTGSEEGKIFKVWGEMSNPLKVPEASKGSEYIWNLLPFGAKNGKIVKKNNITTKTNAEYISENGNRYTGKTFETTPRAAEQLNNPRLNRFLEGKKTDHVVRYALMKGKDGVTFTKIYDGSAYSPEIGYYDPTLTEHVFINGKNTIKAPLGTSNFLMFNMINPGNTGYRYGVLTGAALLEKNGENE